MPVAAERPYTDFPAFRDEWLDTAPAGSTLRYYQTFPDWYPGDLVVIQGLEAAGTPLEEQVHPDFLAFLGRCAARQVTVQRLLLVRGPSDPLYDRTFLPKQRQAYRQIVSHGEQTRWANFNKVRPSLTRLARTNRLARRCLDAARGGYPKAGMWSVEPPADYSGPPATVRWEMDYRGRKFRGGTAYIGDAPDQVVDYDDFWRDIYDHSPLLLRKPA